MASKMSEKLRLDRKVSFQYTFYTKRINVLIDSIGPSIILRSIYIKVPTFTREVQLFPGWGGGGGNLLISIDTCKT